jgi:hypothetical protein
MGRLKIYYSVDEITNNLYTSGSELMSELGSNYIGLYHKYTSTGETYSGATWNPITSIKLIAYTKPDPILNVYKSLKQLKTTYKNIESYKLMITDQNRIDGVVTRSFLKKNNESLFIEVSESTWADWQSNNIDRNLYNGVQLQWYITGPIDDTRQNGVFKPGVISKNKKQIIAAEFTLPGISKKLINPLEFYTDTDFVVPRDINLG